MAKFLLLSCILFAFASVQSNGTGNRRSSPSPPVQAPQLSTPQEPASSCDLLMFKMINCLPYLTKSSKMGYPDDSCCSGFMEVWKFDSNCVCEALKDSVQLGFQLNMTRAVYISCACGFRHISIDKCLSNLSRTGSSVRAATPSPTIPLKKSVADSTSLSNFFMIFINLVVFFMF